MAAENLGMIKKQETPATEENQSEAEGQTQGLFETLHNSNETITRDPPIAYNQPTAPPQTCWGPDICSGVMV